MPIILVVDDNREVCSSLAKLISHMGYEAHCVTSGQDALAFVENKRPDLIILDIMMPGMDGLEVLQNIKADPDTKDLRVVMFSAAADERSRQIAHDRGADDYWVKASIDFDQLARQIQRYFPPSPSNAPSGPGPQ